MSNYTERFREILNEYREGLEKDRKNRKPLSGIFGFGAGPGDDPCHEILDRQAGQLMEELGAGEPAPEETAELVNAVFRAEGSEAWPEYARLALIAIQRHTLPLISRMNPGDRAELAAWYEKQYPKHKRLPVQKIILQELKS